MPPASGDRTPLVTTECLERLSDRSMPGRERRRLGDWVLRAADGVTGRANSAWVTGSPGLEAASALDEVERWYRDRGHTPLLQVFDGPSAAGLEVELDRRRYRREPGADVLVRDLDRWPAPACGTGAVADTFDMSAEPGTPDTSNTSCVSVSVTRDLAALVEGGNAADRVAEMGLTALDRRVVALRDRDGQVVATGLGLVDGEAFGIFAMSTRTRFRRLGFGVRVLDRLVGEAQDVGCRFAWLQVFPANAAAQALYAAAGFVRVHGYNYRVA